MEFAISDRLYGKDELKLCPFCGAIAEVLSTETSTFVECTECHARSVEWYGDKELATQVVKGAWNKRRKYRNG